MHLRAIWKPKHRRQLRVRHPILLIVHKRPNNIRIDRTPPLINQTNTAVLFIERRARFHPETVGAVRFGDLRPKQIGAAVDRLRDSPAVLQEPEGDLGGFVAGVPEAGFAARDHVEFVVGQFEGAVDADDDWH